MEWCNHKYNMNYGNTKKKISESNLGKIISEDTRNKLSLNSKDRIWINNGFCEKFIKSSDFIKYNDYSLGRLKKGCDVG